MKRVNLLIMLVLSFSLSLMAAHAEFKGEYDFKIEFDHNFDDDEEIDCEIRFDDKDKTVELDENSDEEELIFEDDYSGDTDLEVDCDEDVDEIKLEVFYENGDELFDEDYDDSNGFTYELELVDDDDEWFRIEIDHDFDSDDEIDCDLEVDGDKFEYEFTEDDTSSSLRIERNYREEIELDCNDPLDEIELTVFDDDNDEVFERVYEDEDRINYDGDEEAENEFRIDIAHDFDDDTINCELEIDNDKRIDYSFDEDSDNDELRIIKFFFDSFEFSCDEDLDKIEVTIYDDRGDEVDEFELEDDDDFDYEFDIKEYDGFIEVTHEFDDNEIDCELVIDGDNNKPIDYDFDKFSKLSDLRIEEELDSTFEFSCDSKLDSILLIIFEDEDEGDDELDRVVYENENGFSYKFGDNTQQVTQELTSETDSEQSSEEDSQETSDSQSSSQESSSSEVEPEFVEIGDSTQGDVSSRAKGSENENPLSSSEPVAGEETGGTQVASDEPQKAGKSGLTVLLVIGILIIVVFIVLLMFVSPSHLRKKR